MAGELLYNAYNVLNFEHGGGEQVRESQVILGWLRNLLVAGRVRVECGLDLFEDGLVMSGLFVESLFFERN